MESVDVIVDDFVNDVDVMMMIIIIIIIIIIMKNKI